MVRKADLPKHIVHTALDLAVSRGWYNTSLADIAAAAKVPLAQLYAIYPSKGAIVAAFSKQIDEQMLAVAEEEEAEGSPRDRLFDVLMQRFDALKPHKAAVEAILADAGRDPPATLCALPRFMQSMAWMLEAAGINSSGCAGALRAKGLACVYLSTLRVWLNDETPDMARTMAALDKRLRYAERLAELCWPGPRVVPGGTASATG
ncbi:MAG: TetR family transcriptional regulator [Alphaproteobacteria bacterium]